MIQTQPHSAQIDTDLNALQGNRTLGKDDKNAALMEVAKQFESMFLNMMMSSMRDANQVFEEDISVTLRECRILFENFDDLPEDCQRILANMMFNMGRPRLSKFVGMKSGIYAKDWNRAADEMVDSKWYGQVTNRADRLVKRMRALADG